MLFSVLDVYVLDLGNRLWICVVVVDRWLFVEYVAMDILLVGVVLDAWIRSGFSIRSVDLNRGNRVVHDFEFSALFLFYFV